MFRTSSNIFRDAGIVRTSGRGLVLCFAEVSYFVMPEDVLDLLHERPGDVVGPDGEKEGVVLLSPLILPKKREMIVLLGNRIYSVDLSHLFRLRAGKQARAKIREYVKGNT